MSAKTVKGSATPVRRALNSYRIYQPTVKVSLGQLSLAPVVLAVLGLAGCTFNDLRTGEDCPRHNLFQCLDPLPKSMSWDQENLKTRDSEAGCLAAHGQPMYVDDLFLECR